MATRDALHAPLLSQLTRTPVLYVPGSDCAFRLGLRRIHILPEDENASGDTGIATEQGFEGRARQLDIQKWTEMPHLAFWMAVLDHRYEEWSLMGSFPTSRERTVGLCHACQHINLLDSRTSKQPPIEAIVLPLFKVAAEDL